MHEAKLEIQYRKKEETMSTILGILAAILVMAWGMLRKKQRVKTSAPVLVKRYIHRGHSWLRETEDGDVLVGVDDFAQSLIGTVDAVELPRLLKRVEQGNVAWYVKHSHRVVPMVCPVSGRIIEKNEMVLRDPSLVNTSPYGDGWLLRIRPTKLELQLNNLFTGKTAQQWLEQAKTQLVQIFSTTPALMYQDGGLLLDNLADHCSDEEWKKVAREFFLVD